MQASTTDERCSRCGRYMRWTIPGNSFLPNGLPICRACALELQREARDRLETERKTLELPRLLVECGVPRKFVGASFEACDEQTDGQVKSGIMQWAEHPRGFLLIIGDVGTGKTWLGTCAFRDWVTRHRGGRWASWLELLGRVKAGTGRRAGGSSGELKVIKEAPLLLLDDVGAEPPGRPGRSTSWGTSMMAEIVAVRYDAMLPTITTTNLPVEKLAERCDARTISRILEGENVFTLLGCDRRLVRPEPETTVKIIGSDTGRN